MAPKSRVRGACVWGACLSNPRNGDRGRDGDGDVERIALRWVPGSGAIAIERLASGLVNESYRVVRAGRSYSLRVPVADAVELGLDREWECRVVERAAAADLAPVIARCEPKRGILVAQWVEGRSWTSPQVRHAKNIDRVARLLRRIHALSVGNPRRVQSPADWIDYYQAALGRRAYRACAGRQRLELRARAHEHLAALAALPPAAAVLCHSDLHAQNLVVAGTGLVLLDWEYAHVSEGLWDVAGWSCNNDLSAAPRNRLLSSYLGHEPALADQVRLGHLLWLYDYVCLLWSELYVNSRSGRRTEIMARARFLAARLHAAPVVESGNFRHTSRLGDVQRRI